MSARKKSNQVLYTEQYVQVPEEIYFKSDADGKWNANSYAERVQVEIVEMSADTIEMDVKNFHPSLINALRRVLIADVPTVAIEKVHMFQNTSIMPDEVFAHRLGLVPIKVDPSAIAYKTEAAEMDSRNCLKFQLDVKCPSVDKKLTREEKVQAGCKVFTSDLKWIPLDGQKERFNPPPEPAFKDILLMRLNPGQHIECECYCIKSNGKDHAKFSPVCASFFRLHPEVKLTRDVYDEEALELYRHLSDGVINVEKTADGRVKAFVANARAEMMTGNQFRQPNLAEALEISSNMDHVIFTVESNGQMEAEEIIIQGFGVLKKKCDDLLASLANL